MLTDASLPDHRFGGSDVGALIATVEVERLGVRSPIYGRLEALSANLHVERCHGCPSHELFLSRPLVVRDRALPKGATMSLRIASSTAALIVTGLGLSLLTSAAHMPQQLSSIPPLHVHFAG